MSTRQVVLSLPRASRRSTATSSVARVRTGQSADVELAPNGGTDPAYLPLGIGPGGLECLPEGLPGNAKKDDVRPIFVYLHGTKDVLSARMKARSGHYMKEDVRLRPLLRDPTPQRQGRSLTDRLRSHLALPVDQQMLNSQLATLEEPPKEGEKDVIVVSIDQHPDQVIQEAFEKLTKLLAL